MPKDFQGFYKFAKEKGYTDTEIRDEIVAGTATAFKLAKERNIPREQIEAKIESLELPPELYSPPEEAGQHFADKMARARSMTEKMGDFFTMAKSRITGDSGDVQAKVVGNIDMDSLPTIRNKDGSISTVRSMSFNDNGVETLIPTLEQGTGKKLSEDEAIDQFHRTGKFLGKFSTPEEATRFAKNISREQGVRLQKDFIPGVSGKDRTFMEASIILGTRQANDMLGRLLGATAARGVRDITAGVIGTASEFSGVARYAGLETVGESVSRHAGLVREELLPEDPNFADEVLQGFGSMGVFLIPGYGVQAGVMRLASVGTRLASYFGLSAMSTIEALVEGGAKYNESMRRDPDNPELAAERGNAVFWGNLPVLLVMNKIGFFSDMKPATGAAGRGVVKAVGRLGKKLKGIMATGLSEGSQESTQEIMGNIAMFDPLLNGAIRAFGIGAIVGSGVRGLIDLQMDAAESFPYDARPSMRLKTSFPEGQTDSQEAPLAPTDRGISRQDIDSLLGPTYGPDPLPKVLPPPGSPQSLVAASIGKASTQRIQEISKSVKGPVGLDAVIAEEKKIGLAGLTPEQKKGVTDNQIKQEVANRSYTGISDVMDGFSEHPIEGMTPKQATFVFNSLLRGVTRLRQIDKSAHIDIPVAEAIRKLQSVTSGVPLTDPKIESRERDLSKLTEERKEAQKEGDTERVEEKREQENLLNVELNETGNKYGAPKELPAIPEIKKQVESESTREELPLPVEGLAPTMQSLGAAASGNINQEPEEGSWPDAAYRFKSRVAEILGISTPSPQKSPDYSFTDSETESRFAEAQKGITKASIIQKIREGMTRFWNQSTRFFEHLPRGKKFARISHAFLQFRKKRSVTQDEAIRTIENITRDMDDKMVNLFTRAVVLQDLVQEDATGKSLPFGFKSDTLAKDWLKLKAIIDKTPLLSTALAKRELYWESIKERYITAQKDIGFNVLDRLKKKDYFRHQILEYAQSTGSVSGSKIRTPASRGFLKKRMGSEMDINANYAQAEFEVMSRMLMDIEIANVIKMIKTEHDIRPALVKKAKTMNQENMAAKMAQDQSLQQSLATQQGSEDAFMRETLGKEYVEADNIIPEGHAEFQPREGSLFFMVDTIPSGMAQKLQEKIVETIGIKSDDVKKMIAMGGPRPSYIVPVELKDQLDAFEQGTAEANPFLQLTRDLTKSWKIWQLISPRRFFRYNIRNMTGDGDPTLVGNPQSFKYLPRSVKELLPIMFGNWDKATPNVKEWQRLGGFETTLQAQEMGDLEDVKFLSNLFQKSGSGNIAVTAFKKYWEIARGLTDYREALLRYASYISYKDQITKGKGKPDNYGASIPEEIDALEKTEDKAFRLSNELLGAYDEISETGAALRRDFIPFWSWKEVNFRRYVQMFKNATIDNRTAEVVGRTIGVKSAVGAARAGKWLLKATAFWSMLQIYNHTRFPDEERELSEFQRNRAHIILGRDDAGNVKYFSGVGALGDILAWFGLDAAPLLVGDWLRGKRTAKEVAISMGKAPFNILAQGLTPVIKMPMELLAKQQFYPDVFEPRQIRDRWAHLWRHVGLSKEFNVLYGLPSRGYIKTLDSFFYYKVDPLSGSYYDIQNMKRRFMKKKGREFSGFASTPRSESLYRYKQSLRYGDKEGAKKWLKSYAVLGGTRSGMRRSLQNMHPLHGLRKMEKVEFMSGLDADDKRKLRNAERYFREVLSGKKVQ